ncbi:helix-turn-helix domain-containing protein [Photobacterium damselae]|uniref:helix-turn-helix domain-containing protein n=1 Tax=Photobacterium damselae TaxID=38293 RepID=UPI00406951F6
MSFNKRLKAVIKEERYSQKAFAKTVGIPLRTLEDYLSGRTEPGLQAITKIVGHPIFKKYTAWLICSEIGTDSIQAYPSLYTQEQCGLLMKNTTNRT